MAQATPDEAKHFQVLLASNDLLQFRLDLATRKPRVLVLDLALLGDDPVATVEQPRAARTAGDDLIVYAFARWEVVEAAAVRTARVMRALVSVRMLRSNLISLIVRDDPDARGWGDHRAGRRRALGRTRAAPLRRRAARQSAGNPLHRAVRVPEPSGRPVLALAAFEQYSINWAGTANEADAKVHAMLARATGHARALMEAVCSASCAPSRRSTSSARRDAWPESQRRPSAASFEDHPAAAGRCSRARCASARVSTPAREGLVPIGSQVTATVPVGNVAR